MYRILTLSICLSGSLLIQDVRSADPPRPNVLIIAADDLRDELGCLGAEHIHSPNLDRLAARGLLFERAYCQLALCGPSRSSVLSGCRPDTTRAYNNKVHFRDTLGDAVSLPQLFKNNGYVTAGFGKILHNTQKDPASWTEPHFYVQGHQYAAPENVGKPVGIDGIHESNGLIPLVECADVPDNAYRDGMTTDAAVATLRRVANQQQPFMLMVGYHKPHTPFCAPKKYWDLYPRDSIRLAPNPFAPKGAPEFAMSNWQYVRSFKGIPAEGPMSDELAREVKHAYYACISYVDAQVGILLDELEAQGVAENTVVAFWSDHGYQLGDHGMWCKHSNFETSAKVPLIISDPRLGVQGTRTRAAVELIDLFPTVAESCGLPIPDHLDGKSLLPLMKDPRAWDDRETYAFTQYSRSGNKGVSMRTGRYRLTLWRNIKTGELAARELYDHWTDPREDVNQAANPEYRETLARLTSQLETRWTGDWTNRPAP